MDAQAIADELVDGRGYALIEDAIPAALAADARRQILAQVEAAQGGPRAPADERSLSIGHERVLLVDQGPLFEELVQNPTILAVAEALLGEDLTLSAFSARVLMPGARPMGTHVDYPYWALPQPYALRPPLMMQVIWMMQDFTLDNGATFVAPGSQLRTSPPNKELFGEEAIQITGRAGSAIVSHGLLWHDTAPNRTDVPRVAVLINYCNKVVRPMQDFSGLPDEALARASPRLRRLLGKTFFEDLTSHLRPRTAAKG